MPEEGARAANRPRGTLEAVLEVFVGGGRAAITSGGAPPATARGAYVTAHSAASVAGAGAWAMGCGWAQ